MGCCWVNAVEQSVWLRFVVVSGLMVVWVGLLATLPGLRLLGTASSCRVIVVCAGFPRIFGRIPHKR